jgi:hypothetical protein
MYTINANKIGLTFRYFENPARLVVAEIECPEFFLDPGDLGVGSDAAAKLEIKWGANSEVSTADLHFEGDLVPVDVDPAMAVRNTARHYTVTFDASPLPPGTILAAESDERVFVLGPITPVGGVQDSLTIGSRAAGSRNVARSKSRPEEIAGARPGWTPSSLGVKLVLLPTRKTNMPGDLVSPHGLPLTIRRS